MAHLDVEVPLRPIPQGSKRGFRVGNRVVIVDNQGQELGLYREAIARAVREKIDTPVRGWVSLQVDFFFARPKSHYGKKGVLPSAPVQYIAKPDLDKLQRAVMDALTGVLYADDAQVSYINASKAYSPDGTPSVYIEASWNDGNNP